MKISVIVPAYHERERVILGLKDLFSTLEFLQTTYEVIVVVDGDPETFEALKTFTHPHLKILAYEKNRGKGYALIFGFRESQGESIIFWDAGTQISQESLKLAWWTFSFSRADIVVGSKRHPLSKVKYPLKRKIYSFFCQWAAYLFFGLTVKDTQTGLKIFRRGILAKITPKIKTSGYAVDIEMLIAARRFGFKNILESPVDLSHYQFGGGVNYRAVYQVAFDMLKTYRRLVSGYYESGSKNNLQSDLFLTMDLEKDPWTSKIPEAETNVALEILKKSGQKITFFISGEIYSDKPELVRQISKDGHEIGLHSFTHRRIKDIQILKEELSKSQQFIRDFKPRGFRAPYLHIPKGSLEILKQAGFKYDASSYFFKRCEENVIVEFPTSAIRLGPFASRKFSLPLSLAPAIKRGLFPLGGALLTALIPKFQRTLLQKFGSCVIFLHPWQFSNHSLPQTLLSKPNLLPYRRNCLNAFKILTEEFKLKKLEDKL